jgi:Cdc6-like AAA superfamily ATPase
MWSTTHVYSGILGRLYGVKEKKPEQGLNERLRGGVGNNELTKIIILDEIDQFINDQRFLYNMLEWLWVGAKLILVLISNVIDLTLKV